MKAHRTLAVTVFALAASLLAAPLVSAQDAPVPATDPQFDKQMGTVEEQVTTLKEQVFRSKATLQLLKEIVVQGGSSAARSSVVHTNRLGRSFRLESVAYYLNGQSIFAKADPTGAFDAVEEMQVWEGAVPPGSHSLSVNAVLKGKGFGVFTYVDGYVLKVTNSFKFQAVEMQTAAVRVTFDEKRGVGVNWKERPEIGFTVTPIAIGPEAPAAEPGN